MDDDAKQRVRLIVEMAEAITEGVSPEEAAELCEALSKICLSLSNQVKRPFARIGLKLASSVLEDQAETFSSEVANGAP